jgi:hypothetical protein
MEMASAKAEIRQVFYFTFLPSRSSSNIVLLSVSDTVEHLVPRPLSARTRNSIWRQAKECSLIEFIFYIFYHRRPRRVLVYSKYIIIEYTTQ